MQRHLLCCCGSSCRKMWSPKVSCNARWSWASFFQTGSLNDMILIFFFFLRNVSMFYFLCIIRNYMFYVFVHVGSTSSKYWRRRYSIDKGNWKWWYRSCLPCYFPYLAKGILLITVVMILDYCFYELISLSNFCKHFQTSVPEFFARIQARPLARDLFITYARYLKFYHWHLLSDAYELETKSKLILVYLQVL